MLELNEKIPNNVNLSSDKKLQRALEQWQPKFVEWWKDMGPSGFQAHDVYLRTAISVDSKGWANFGYTKMPDYRWGIFLAEPEANRKIGFGDLMGEPAWQEVPGEHRATLRRLIVTQGDTEPASVEQQRMLGHTCPSQYDLRNLFQVNVEEGRHLWAMVYLLHTYFGRDGREEGELLLQRRSGDEDKPRILGAFNEPVTDWLAFFMFTFFTDRDGKFQLLALAESGFDPLSRTCRFMLTEEAHHMFVGETGVQRVVSRTADLMKQAGTSGDVRKLGGFDLPLIQRYLNLWYALSLDLFGSEVSTNAASFFAQGLKGRAREDKFEDHRAVEGIYPMEVFESAPSRSAGELPGNLSAPSRSPGELPGPLGGTWKKHEIPMRNAMNEVLRDAYVDDCQRGVDKWNKELEKRGLPDRLTLPSRRFYRQIGIYAGHHFDPKGNVIPAEEFEKRRDEWLPTASDHEYSKSLQTRAVMNPGEMANWIAPPARGINHQPEDFVYVRTDA